MTPSETTTILIVIALCYSHWLFDWQPVAQPVYYMTNTMTNTDQHNDSLIKYLRVG